MFHYEAFGERLKTINAEVLSQIVALLDNDIIFDDMVTFLSDRQHLDGRRLYRWMKVPYIDLFEKNGNIVSYRLDNDDIFNILDRIQVLHILEGE